MHDTRAQTELRLRRFTAERIEPALYRRSRAADGDGVAGAGRTGSVRRGGRAIPGRRHAPLSTGDPWGPPWGTTWLRITGTVPTDWGSSAGGLPAGDPGRGADRPRLPRRVARVSGRGPGVRPGRPDDQGHRAAERRGPGAGWAGRRRSTCSSRRRRTPRIEGDRRAAVLADPARRSGDRRHRAAVPAGRDRAGAARRHRLGAAQGHRDAGRPDARTADRPAPAGADPARAGTDDGRDGPARRRRHRGGRPGRTGRGAGLARLRQRASPARRRARAHRLGVALAGPGDDPQMRPHVLHRAGPDGRARSDFVFACSSAQQFAWIKQYYPELFDRIRAKVAAGQFVPVGGMWVESDTNMPGGEAMARQFVAGKRFFLEEFGVDCEEVWLPDSFGYSAALPQIVAAAGARYFLTQKISWNQTNRMPHHTFWWQGIDGTRVFTHFPPVDTYNSQLVPAELAHAERNYSEHGRGSMSLVPFGFGDGGGGPTREMIARGRRARSLEGSPTVEFGSPRSFFEQAQADYPDAPVWAGEMYLELHRGTYTSQSRTKHGNRRSEHLLREAELWATTAAVLLGRRLSLRPAREALADGASAAVPRHPAGLVDRLGVPGRRAELRRAGRRSRGPDRASRWPSWPGRGTGPSPSTRRRTSGTACPRSAPASAADPDGPDVAAHRGRRPADAGQRAAAGGASTVGGCSPPSSTWRPAARWSRPAARPTCCRCTGTSRTSGTPGTSTSTTAGTASISTRRSRSP